MIDEFTDTLMTLDNKGNFLYYYDAKEENYDEEE